jgi:hypothetical protein
LIAKIELRERRDSLYLASMRQDVVNDIERSIRTGSQFPKVAAVSTDSVSDERRESHDYHGAQ